MGSSAKKSTDGGGMAHPKDDEWVFLVHHSQVYQWEPVKETDIPEGSAELYIDSYYTGFKMVRRSVAGEFTSTSGCHVPSIQEVNEQRAAVGKATRPDWLNLIQEFCDGSWAKQFPVESITKVEVLQGPPDLAGKFNTYLGIGEEA